MNAASWKQLVESDDVQQLRAGLRSANPQQKEEFLVVARALVGQRVAWGYPNIARPLMAVCEDVPEVLGLLTSLVLRDKAEALDFLGAMETFPSRIALPLAVSFLGHSSPTVRVCAVDAVGAAGDLGTASVLASLFTKELDGLVRAHVAPAVVACVVRGIRELAVMVFSDPDIRVRNQGGLSLLALLDITVNAWPEAVDRDGEAVYNLIEWMWLELPEVRTRLDSLVSRLQSRDIAQRYAELRAT